MQIVINFVRDSANGQNTSGVTLCCKCCSSAKLGYTSINLFWLDSFELLTLLLRKLVSKLTEIVSFFTRRRGICQVLHSVVGQDAGTVHRDMAHFCCLSALLRNTILDESSSHKVFSCSFWCLASQQFNELKCERAVRAFWGDSCSLFVIGECKFLYPPSLFEPAN
jgi:hypothetical protein